MAAVVKPDKELGGRFEIEQLVASGGMATVYRARDRASGAHVALKLLSAAQGHGHVSERFAREARILSTLHHPGIVAYVAHGKTHEGQLFLAMQWLDGEDLAARLRRGPLALRESLTFVRQVAAALLSAHERRIVHRDIKPSNLFLRDGKVEHATMLDFGIARDMTAMEMLTKTGSLFGTPSYIAPERARGQKEVLPAADIFSMGCVFYECLAGRRPFDADHVAGVLARILFDQPAPLSRARPNVPEAWARLISRMLEKDPGRRPRDAAELLQELHALPDAPDEPDGPSRAPATPSKSWVGVEQTLATVVLATPREAVGRDISSLDLAEVKQVHRSFEALQSMLTRLGSRLEVLADGSLLACVNIKDNAKDQAIVAARTALAIREQWTDARIAVATGRSAVEPQVPVGEAVDRVTLLLTQGQTRSLEAAPTEGIILDEMTASLLDSRFVLAPFDGGALLLEERANADEARLLLGKPTPCVGREQELSQLESILSRCIDEEVAQAVLLTAPPGAGKSRLRHEFLRRQGAKGAPLTTLLGAGDPLSASSPYGLLSQALRRHAGLDKVESQVESPAERRERLRARLCEHIEPSDAQRVAELLGELCGIPFPADASAALAAARSDSKLMSEQIAQAFLDWLRAECAAGPVLFVFEDLQWGDKLTVNLIDVALREVSERPIFVLAVARPEVSELFPGLWSGRAHAIPLHPLSRRASERLVREVLGEAALRPGDVARIVEQSNGNALFLEELIRAAAEGKGDEVPETVIAMLQGRLSRLSAEARTVLRAASVFGETFWASGVRFLCEPSVRFDITTEIDRLVTLEILEKHPRSRFPEESEHGFRHALVRDAAYSLLADANRVTGHRLACRYLVEIGETDAMALAEHALRGEDNDRAIEFFLRAADQSLELNDLEGALSRAAQGVACGAKGEPLGIFRAIQCLASFGLASWAKAAEAGLDAIEFLPRGGLWWCRVFERLFHVLPTTGNVERFQELIHVFAEVEPDPSARSPHACAAAYLVGMFGLMGARDALTPWLSRLEAIRASIPEHDAYAHGTLTACEAWAKYVMDPDVYLALRLGQASVSAFEQARHPIKLVVAMIVSGMARAYLADLPGAEETLRRAVKIARDARDPYSISNSEVYLGTALLDSPGHLDEAETLATAILETNFSEVYVGIARWILASVRLQRGQAPEAEAEARRAIDLLTHFQPYMPMAQSVLIRALGRQGRLEEAADVARKGLDLLASLGGTGFSEVPLRVAAAEALDAAGEPDEGRRALRSALDQIGLRADKIPDPAERERYITGRPENIRAHELARAWFGEAG
ncbi:MAG TPA: protein kinase [Polyangiaceae bacterium]|nr:protein kinase [Polyangiaceae bacterium]